MNEKEELLQKIKALADRGIGGEKQNAEEMLQRLMKKYGITEENLSDITAQWYPFFYRDEYERKLLSQVIFMFLGDCTIKGYANSRKKLRFVECTKSQRLKIQVAFDFYRIHLKNGFEKFYKAFINREGIFPDSSIYIPEEQDPTPPDIEMLSIYTALKKQVRHYMIED